MNHSRKFNIASKFLVMTKCYRLISIAILLVLVATSDQLKGQFTVGGTNPQDRGVDLVLAPHSTYGSGLKTNSSLAKISGLMNIPLLQGPINSRHYFKIGFNASFNHTFSSIMKVVRTAKEIGYLDDKSKIIIDYDIQGLAKGILPSNTVHFAPEICIGNKKISASLQYVIQYYAVPFSYEAPVDLVGGIINKSNAFIDSLQNEIKQISPIDFSGRKDSLSNLISDCTSLIKTIATYSNGRGLNDLIPTVDTRHRILLTGIGLGFKYKLPVNPEVTLTLGYMKLKTWNILESVDKNRLDFEETTLRNLDPIVLNEVQKLFNTDLLERRVEDLGCSIYQFKLRYRPTNWTHHVGCFYQFDLAVSPYRTNFFNNEGNKVKYTKTTDRAYNMSFGLYIIL